MRVAEVKNILDRYSVRLIAVGLLCFVAGFTVRGCAGSAAHPDESAADAGGIEKAEIWTCSMHPQIRQPKPGLCPICAMDLIPAGGSSEEDGGRAELTLSPSAMKIAGISTATVQRRFAEVRLRLSGKVQADETGIAYIAPRMPVRIDRLYANYSGVQVRKGDPLADVYSPELMAARQELLSASATFKSMEGGGASAGLESARNTLQAAREKLRLWQLLPEQIAEIEGGGGKPDHFTFYSPITGVVIDKMDTFDGMYAETGMKLFTVADLSRVWIIADAYEADLQWLKYAQEVEFEVEAYPGEIFAGRIAFIAPTVDPDTRTVKVRINAGNSDGRLKPEMFARVYVSAAVAADGKIVQPDLAGKWISPVHPEIIRDEPGTCDVCGKPLVRAEDLGYAGAGISLSQAPLVVPASAPLITGRRAIVYKTVPGQEGKFEGRQVVLGPRAGDYFVVKSGLSEGDEVVVNGAFKIDSSLQIRGLPSMMQQPEEEASEVGVKPGPQVRCPIMGGAINRDIFVDYGGYRIYFCCPGCEGPFLKDAEKILEKMRAEGIELESSPLAPHPTKQERDNE